MKKHYLSLILLFITTVCYSQTIKFAIVDFDNISGNVKYDGLVKQ